MGAEGISYSLHLLITHLGGCREKKVCPGPSPTPLSALTLTVPRGVSQQITFMVSSFVSAVSYPLESTDLVFTDPSQKSGMHPAPSGHQILSITQKSPIVPKKKQLNTSVVLPPLESWLLSIVIVLTFLSYLKVIFTLFFLFKSDCSSSQ